MFMSEVSENWRRLQYTVKCSSTAISYDYILNITRIKSLAVLYVAFWLPSCFVMTKI